MRTMRNSFIGLIAVSAVLTACEDTRSITSAPGGGFGYGVLLAKPAASNVPRGIIRFPVAGRLGSANAANDSIVVTLTTPDTLAPGSQYVVWAANDSATKFYRLTGDLIISRVDTTQNAAGDVVVTPRTIAAARVNGFSNGGANMTVRYRAFRAGQAGLVATDSIGAIIVSTETGTVGNVPGSVRSIWGRFSEASASQTAIRFGNFAARTTEQYVFSTTAVPAITPRGRLELREGVVVAIDSNYFKPPRGYVYTMWAVKVDSLSNRPIDTLYLGERTGPAPQRASFFNADTDNALSVNNVIPAMNQRVKLDTLSGKAKLGPATRPLKEYGWVNVTLQNKAMAKERMGAGIIMQANLPPSIRGR
ncbi:MAG: hypothetical protein RLZZ621_234 [Gemmatimonadota bacterium]